MYILLIASYYLLLYNKYYKKKTKHKTINLNYYCTSTLKKEIKKLSDTQYIIDTDGYIKL